MGNPIAKAGDKVIGLDTHVVMLPSPGGPVPTPMPMPFNGTLNDSLSDNIFIDNAKAAVKGSVASNTPPHIPTGGPFKTPPSNRATVATASDTVFFSNKGVARLNDDAKWCNDPSDDTTGHVVAVGTVFAG